MLTLFPVVRYGGIRIREVNKSVPVCRVRQLRGRCALASPAALPFGDVRIAWHIEGLRSRLGLRVYRDVYGALPGTRLTA